MESKNLSLSASMEKEGFLDQLNNFLTKSGTPIKRIPLLGGRELDLCHLFHKVQSLGGSKIVSERRLWGEVARSFKLPPSVTSASYAVRQNYMKLLERFEHYLADPIANDPLIAPMPRPPVTPPTKTLPWTPLILDCLQATPNSQKRGSGHTLSVDRLVRSLLSGYPNEVDFSFNILTILSHNEGGVVLSEASGLTEPRLLAVMLAHVGLFSGDDPVLEEVYHESWYKESETDFIQFWELTVPEWMFVSLLDSSLSRAAYVPTLFHPHTAPPDSSVECLRVTQLISVLRNLSFSQTQAKELINNYTVLRFLLLCSNNRLPSIKCLGLETLANLAPYTTLPPYTSHTAEILLGTVYECILSQDKAQVLKGIEILGELSWTSCNMPRLLATPTDVYSRIFKLLLVPDALILLGCLDALYSLTFSSPEMGRNILTVDRSVQVLVNLLMMKMEDLSSNMLKNVKLFERKTVSQSTSSKSTTIDTTKFKSVSHAQPPKSIKIGNTTIPTLKLPAKSQGQLNSSSLSRALTTSNQGFIPVLTIQQLQELLSKSVPKPVSMTASGNVKVNVLSSSVSSTGVVGQSSIVTTAVSKIIGQSSMTSVVPAAGQITKTPTAIIDTLMSSSGGGDSGSAFTHVWLSTSYEVCGGSYMSPLEMYSSYLKAVSEFKGAVKMASLADFNNVIKTVFPDSLSTKITVAGTTVYMVAGIAKKTTPTNRSRDTITIVTSSTKPINIDSIRGSTTTAGLATSLTSSITSLTSLTTPQKPQALTKVLQSGGTPIQKSGVQRSESRPASPLTVARKALDLPTAEVKGCPNAISNIPNEHINIETKGGQEKLFAGDKIANNISLSHGHGIALSNHIQDGDFEAPVSKKLRLEELLSNEVIDIDKTLKSMNGPTSEILLPDKTTSTPMECDTNHTTTPPAKHSIASETFFNSSSSKDSNLSSPVGASLSPSVQTPLSSSTTVSQVSSGDLSSTSGSSLQSDTNSCKEHSSIGSNIREISPLSVTSLDRTYSPSPQSARSSPIPTIASSLQLELSNTRKTERNIDNLTKTMTENVTMTTGIATTTVSMATLSKLITPPLSTSISNSSNISLPPVIAASDVSAASSDHVTGGVNSGINSNQVDTIKSAQVDAVVVGDITRPICLWGGCASVRSNWAELFHHVVTTHLSHPQPHPLACQWTGCSSNAKRMGPSLLTHLQGHHCSPGPPPTPPNIARTLLRIKQVPTLADLPIESSLTKAVHLTAALVLRNMVRSLPEATSKLLPFEARLSEVACSNSEASNAISETLYLMYHSELS